MLEIDILLIYTYSKSCRIEDSKRNPKHFCTHMSLVGFVIQNVAGSSSVSSSVNNLSLGIFFVIAPKFLRIDTLYFYHVLIERIVSVARQYQLCANVPTRCGVSVNQYQLAAQVYSAELGETGTLRGNGVNREHSTGDDERHVADVARLGFSVVARYYSVWWQVH